MYLVVRTPSPPFLNTGQQGFAPFLKTRTRARNGPLADCSAHFLHTTCMFIHTLFHLFLFFTAGYTSTPSCTLCHLARSLCWQSSRRSLIKHDFMHLRSYPWRNRCEIRAPRPTLRFVFYGICDFKYYQYFLLLKMKSDPITHWP